MPLKAKNLRMIVAVAVLLGTVVCSAQRNSKVVQVSLIQLIANPDRFDGQVVQVTGYFSMGREGDILYLSKEDYTNGLLANGIWVRRSDAKGCSLSLDQKYVQIVGTFKKHFSEQLGTPSSGIPTVLSCRFWSDPKDPFSSKVQKLLEPNRPKEK